MNLIRKGLMGLFLAGALSAFHGCTNYCKDVNCLNGGVCDEETGECLCAAGFEGVDCGTAVNAKFVGSWLADESCTLNGDRSETLVITAVEGSNSLVDISGLWAQSDETFRAEVSILEDEFSISLQRFDNFLYQLRTNSGLISTDGNTLTYEFVIYDLNVNVVETCTGTAVRM